MVLVEVIANNSNEEKFTKFFSHAQDSKRRFLYELQERFRSMQPEEVSGEIDYSLYMAFQGLMKQGKNPEDIRDLYFFLRRCAINHLINQTIKFNGTRRKHTQISIFKKDEDKLGLIDTIASNYPLPESEACSRELEVKTRGLFRKLDLEERKLVYLRYSQGLTQEEIAHVLEHNRNRVSRELKRLGNTLKRRMMASGEEIDTKNLSAVISEWFLQNPRNWATDSRLQLPKEEIEKQHQRYLQGQAVFNPIQMLNPGNTPIVRRIINEVYQSKSSSPSRETEKRGLRSLLKKNKENLTTLALQTNPELVHKLPNLQKWKRSETSVKIALDAIEEVLQTRPDYREAQEREDRSLRVKAINKLLEEESLTRFFRDLEPLMTSFVDPTGEYGIEKQKSPKALLRFYDRKKAYNLFDRTESEYVPLWAITERSMWTRKDSFITGITAIQDCLRDLPGYRQLEETKDRTGQLYVIDSQLLKNLTNKERFKKRLSGMMTHLIDPRGKNGIKRPHSIYETLAFYSLRKKLGWNNPHNPVYLNNPNNPVYSTGGYKKQPEVIFKNQEQMYAIRDRINQMHQEVKRVA